MEKTAQTLNPCSYWVTLQDALSHDVIISRWARQTGKTSNLLMLVRDYCGSHCNKNLVIVTPHPYIGRHIMERVAEMVPHQSASSSEILTHSGNRIVLRYLYQVIANLQSQRAEIPDLILFDDYTYQSGIAFQDFAREWTSRIARENLRWRSHVRTREAGCGLLGRLWRKVSSFQNKPISEPPHRACIMWSSNSVDSFARESIENAAREIGTRVKESYIPIHHALADLGMTPEDLLKIQYMLGDESFIREYADYNKSLIDQNGSC